MEKKFKRILWIILSIFIIGCVFITLLVIFSYQSYNQNKSSANLLTSNEAKQIAAARITQDYNFKNLKGYDLKIISEPENCGVDCYKIRYEYKINQSNIPNLNKIEVVLILNGDEVRNFTLSEIINTDGSLCIDRCGDGICNEATCALASCPCPETPKNCRIDC